MKETEARSIRHDELKCEKDRDRDKCPTTTHTLNEALIGQRITHNDNHYGATHPSSSKMARVVGMTVGRGQQARDEMHTVSHRATTTAGMDHGREGAG
jgi:hypothetical protein